MFMHGAIVATIIVLHWFIKTTKKKKILLLFAIEITQRQQPHFVLPRLHPHLSPFPAHSFQQTVTGIKSHLCSAAQGLNMRRVKHGKQGSFAESH